MFEPSMCENCTREIVRTYPETDLCEQCDVLIQNYPLLQFLPFSTSLGQAAEQRASQETNHSRKKSKRRKKSKQRDVTIGDLLVPFLCFDYQRGARKRFLYCALLSFRRVPSSFKKFTYEGNGMHAWISQNKDILDLILSFV